MRANIEKHVDAWIDVCDMHAGDRLESFLETGGYTMIGLSVQFSIQHDEYVRVAALAKEKVPTAYVAAGGFHAAVVPPPKGVDFVAAGWGERWFANFLLHNLRDEIAHPEFTLSEINRYWEIGKPHDLRSKTDRWISFETSRGCVRHCKFCGTRGVWDRYHPFSLGWINGYLRYLGSKGVRELFVEDDNAALQPERFREVMELFAKHGMWWSAPNGIEIRGLSKALDGLKDSGCWRLSLAFETGVEDTARKMGILDKWVHPPEALALVEWLNTQGIETCGFFVIGWPGETIVEMRRTLEFANALPLGDRHVYIATPYPGTELYEMCKEKRFLVNDGPALYRDLRYTKALIRTKQWKPQQVEELRRKDREEALRRRGELNV